MYEQSIPGHNHGMITSRYQFFVDESGRLHESSVYESLARLVEVFPSLDSISMEAETMLERCHRLIALERDALWAPLGLTGSRFLLLRLLYASEGKRQTMGQIAGQLNLEPNNVTQLVGALVTQGLVEKQADKGDKRVVFAALTPQGEELFLDAMEAGVERNKQSLSVLDPRERQTLSHLLTKVRMHMLANASRLEEDHPSDRNRLARRKRRSEDSPES